jgi:FkbM family methyltransferase
LTGNSKLIISKGQTGATGNYYNGLHEFNDMLFMLHFLRIDEIFYDVGANIGVYTILASAEIGAKTYSIEPIPYTFNSLASNIIINNIQEKVIQLNVGVGDEEKVLFFTSNLDTVNHVVSSSDSEIAKVSVKTILIDNISEKDKPILMKIDVEGFETPAILGATNTLSNPKLKALIIELNGSGLRYGYDDTEIHKKLLNYGFKPYNYLPRQRELIEIDKYNSHNTIYCRDIDFIKERLSSSKKIKIKEQFI